MQDSQKPPESRPHESRPHELVRDTGDVRRTIGYTAPYPLKYKGPHIPFGSRRASGNMCGLLLRPGFRGRPRHVIHDAFLLDVCICAIKVLHILLYVSCQLILHTRHLDPNKPEKRNVTCCQSRKHSKPSISGRSLLPSAFAHFRVAFRPNTGP